VKREPVYRFLLVSLGIVVALAVAEIVARVVLPAPPTVISISGEDAAAGGAGGEPTSRATLPRHPEEGFVYMETPTGRRLRPSAETVILNHKLSKRRVEIRTNSLGYRNPEIGAKRGRRILFLGDSITFGDFLPEEETFVRIIEEMAAENSKDWETVNAAVGAVSLKTEIAILMETGLSVDPEVIVLCFYLNDFASSPGIFIQDMPALVTRSRLATYVWLAYRQREAGRRPAAADHIDLKQWHEDYTHALEHAWPQMSDEQRAFQREVLDAFADWGGAWSPHAWEYMGPLFEELSQLADEHGSQLVIVAFPVKPQVEAASPDIYPQEQLARIGAALGIPVLDLLPLLRQARASGMEDLFYDHCHHTPGGNRLIAAAIYRFLLDHARPDQT
jgi:lysophospholipase L1-like esterase